MTRAEARRRLPVVLNRDEVKRLIAAVAEDYRLMTQLLYGGGLRLMECLRLRVKDVDFDRRMIVVRDGKGRKDRVEMLPERMRGRLTRLRGLEGLGGIGGAILLDRGQKVGTTGFVR